MALENPQFPPYQDRGASKPGTSPHLPEGQVSTGIGTITRPADISPSLAEAAAEGTIATVTKTASVGGLSLGKALLIGTPLLGVVAGGVFALSQDRNPSAHPVDNAPVSDKAPEPAANQPGIVVNPEPITPNVAEVPASSGPTPPPKEAPTPEAEVKVAPVEIFPQEMNRYIEIIDFKNAKGQRVFIVGIIGLPEGKKEVPFSAPIGGKLRRATNDPNYASVGDLNDLTLTSFAFNGFKPDEEKNVQPGNGIGVLTDTGYRETLGGKVYIATIDVSTKNPSTNEWDNEGANTKVREYFPRASIVSAEYSPQTYSVPDPKIKQMVEFADKKPAGLR